MTNSEPEKGFFSSEGWKNEYTSDESPSSLRRGLKGATKMTHNLWGRNYLRLLSLQGEETYLTGSVLTSCRKTEGTFSRVRVWSVETGLVFVWRDRTGTEKVVWSPGDCAVSTVFSAFICRTYVLISTPTTEDNWLRLTTERTIGAPGTRNSDWAKKIEWTAGLVG